MIECQFLLGYIITGLGEVVSVGAQCKRAKIGQSVLYMNGASFAEYTASITPTKNGQPTYS